MRKLFIINGKGGSGKDTFVNLLKKIDDSIMSISSVSEVKKIAEEYFGYTGEKTDKERKLLSDIKLLQTEANDGPFEYIKKMLILFPNNHIFFHIREPEEIEKFKLFTGAKTVLVERDTLDQKVYGNMADDEVSNYDYNIIVYNTKLKLLGRYAQKFYKVFIKEA